MELHDLTWRVKFYQWKKAKSRTKLLQEKSSLSQNNSIKQKKDSEAATGGVLLKKLFLKALQNSQEHTSAKVSFFNKVVFFNEAATLLKKRLWHKCFLVNFAKFLKTPFSQNTSGRLLLKIETKRKVLLDVSTVKHLYSGHTF